jgi:hypothetical protein
MTEKNSHLFIYGGMAVLLAVMAFNALTIPQILKDFTVKVKEAKQRTALPEIELTIISSSCKECSSVSGIVSSVKALDINIVKETVLESGSDAAKALIKEYKIKRLPAVVLKGETSKLELQEFRQQNNALLFDSVQAPYEEASSGKIIGRVSAIIVEDKSCSVCRDFTLLLENFKQSQVFIAEEKIIDYKTREGQSIVSQNNISKIPALLLSDDADAYPEILQGLRQLGLTPKNGFYVIESSAPYIEPNTGKLRGVVDVTYLKDETCLECYDVMMHKQILERLGIALGKEETIEASSSRGQELIQKYKIDKVPTIILQGDFEVYTQVEGLWLQQLGTKEEDGSYVFRELTALGKDTKFKELN